MRSHCKLRILLSALALQRELGRGARAVCVRAEKGGHTCASPTVFRNSVRKRFLILLRILLAILLARVRQGCKLRLE